METISVQDRWRAGCFFAALFLYALFSSPTPDNPGLWEALIGALLVFGIGFSAVFQALRFDLEAPFWRAAGQALFIFGLSIPLITGFVQGHAPVLVLRDFLPFLFFLLPLFADPFFAASRPLQLGVLLSVIFTGLAFSARAIFEQYEILSAYIHFSGPGELTYFANAPTVLFSALFLLGFAGFKFVNAARVSDLFKAVFLMALPLLPLIAMALSLQRASLGYAGLYILVLFVVGFYKRPLRTFVAAALALPFLLLFDDVIFSLFQALAAKTSAHGFNMRFEEMAAVWREISASPWTLLFGEGWGATFESPAVAGVRVNFTHSLLTSALLKTGLVGLGLAGFYLLGLAKLLFSFPRTRFLLALAIAGPVLIDVFLYASFKSLDFGLVLLLIPVYALTESPVASKP